LGFAFVFGLSVMCRIVHDNRRGCADAHNHLLNLIHGNRMTLQQNFQRVERRLDRRSHGPFLDVRFLHLVALAEFFDKPRRIGLRRIGHEKIVSARQNVVHSRPARLHEQRRGDAAARRHPAVNESFLNVLRIALPRGDAGGLLRRIVEHPAHSLRVQARRARGGRRCPENSGEAVRAPVFLALNAGAAHGQHEARSNIVAERHGAQEPSPVNAKLFAHRERGRNHGASGMRERRGVRVVRLVRMRQHAVRERRFDRPAHDIRRDNRGDFFTAVAFRKLERRAPRQKFRSGDHGGERVENVLLGLLDCRVRQRTVARFAHVRAEPGHRGADRIRGQRRYARKSRGYRSPRRALQPASPVKKKFAIWLSDLPNFVAFHASLPPRSLCDVHQDRRVAGTW
jgi:hypothetical protein